MKRIAFSAWLAAVLCGAVGGCSADSVNSQSKAAAPIGSWRGSVVTFDLGSDGRASYKDPRVAEFTGRCEWLPNTQAAGILVLTSSALSAANPLRFGITWLNKNAVRFCDTKDHCDTLSRRIGIDKLMLEMKAAQKSPGAVREEFRRARSATAVAPAEPPPGAARPAAGGGIDGGAEATAPSSGDISQMNVDQIEQLLKSGNATPEQVIQAQDRLRVLGIQ